MSAGRPRPPPGAAHRSYNPARDHENYLVISGFLLYQGKKTRNIKSWDQQNDLVIRGFCYIRPLYNEVPLYCTCISVLCN